MNLRGLKISKMLHAFYLVTDNVACPIPVEGSPFLAARMIKATYVLYVNLYKLFIACAVTITLANVNGDS
jgi:hypothetical protein